MKIRIACVLLLSACASDPVHFRDQSFSAKLIREGEVHFTRMKQMTFRGENAEAYWSFNSKYLTFQHRGPDPLARQPEEGGVLEAFCDQIYRIRTDGSDLQQISNGRGRTTCSFFTPNNNRILYSSTISAGDLCPPVPDRKQGYAWPLYPAMRIYSAKIDGTDTLPSEPSAPTAYTAETTVCENGTAVFTSDRDGDLELYTAQINSLGGFTDIKRITNNLGYDGGAVFSPDCRWLAWRASRPRTKEAKDEYAKLLKQHLVRPSQMELWIAKADGTESRQVTMLDAASFAPTFTPDGAALVFSSNYPHPRGRVFHLFKILLDGTGLEQISFSNTFDSFPMFSPDGRYLAFASNRNSAVAGDTNIFIAEWQDPASTPKIPIETDQIKSQIQQLASEAFEGRGMSTVGIEKAEAYVADEMRTIGLNSFGDRDDFRVPVEFQSGIQVAQEKTSLKIDEKKAILGQNFSPLSFSSSGQFTGEIVDAGYGLVIPEQGRDDYAGKSVSGKIALIRRFVPKELGLSSDQEKSYSDLNRKAFIAREKGAKAVLFYAAEDGAAENFRLQFDASELVSEAGLLAGLINRDLASNLHGKRASLEIELVRNKATRYNIVGTTGTGCSSLQNWIFIGAHLDHLGHGGAGSFDKTGALHLGADDNASGVAALLQSARILKRSKAGKTCFAFAAFTGEELGIVGSSNLVKILKQKKIQTKAMINLDMVGRLSQGSLQIFGSETSSVWPSLLEKSCGKAGLDCKYSGDGYGPSDHMPFFIAGSPVLHFFTGVHADYHRPTDTADKINFLGIQQVGSLVANLAQSVHETPQFDFKKPKNKPLAIQEEGDPRSYGAYLGTVPDYSEMQMGGAGNKGAKLSGALPGSPAEAAGVQKDDTLRRITLLDDQKKTLKTLDVQNLQDFSNALQEIKPNQKVRLTVIRGEKEIELEATVGRKPKR